MPLVLRRNAFAYVLLALLFGGLLAGGLRSPLAWTIAACLLWASASLSERRPNLAELRRWGPWLLWLLVCLLTSSQPLKGLYPWARWAGVAVFAVMTVSVWGQEDRGRWLNALWACALVLGFAARWSARHANQWELGESMTGLLPPYYNYTAFVVAAGAAAAAAALLVRTSWRPVGLLAFFCWILYLQRARAAFLGLLAAFLLAFARRFGWRRLVLVGAATGLLGLAAFAFLPQAQRDYMFKRDKGQVAKRPEIWAAALAVARDHPILGEGPGSFEAGFRRHNFASRYRVTNYQFSTPYANSEPLHAAAETGFVGVALLLGVVILGTRLPSTREGTLEQEAALAAFTCMSVQLLVDNMLQVPALAMLYFSAIAVQRPQVPSQDLPAPARPWAAVCAVGLTLSLTAWLPDALYSSSMDRADAMPEPEARMAAARRAVALFPAEPEARQALGRAWLSYRPPRLELAAGALREAARLSPKNALYPVMVAELLRAQGRGAEMDGWVERALELEPNFLQARLLRAELLARGGRKEGARQELSEVERRRKALELAGVYIPDRSRYTGYDLSVCAFDAARFAEVKALAR